MASELVPVEREDRIATDALFNANHSLPLTAETHARISEAFARHRLAALEAQASRIAELEAGLRAIESAEATYRYAHDVLGGGDSKTGRAWDLMRRAGDRARTLLGDREG